MTGLPLWTLTDFVAACEGWTVGAVPDRIDGISIDSRSLGAGDAFFAIQGEARDGHEFVAAALGNGAALAVVSEEKFPGCPVDGRYVVVDDVFDALRRLARAARARSRARIVAVTGSVGKTSTKEALRVALSTSGKVHASVASYNNHWGVPLTLARMPADADFGVFEIGMNHAGEIRPLTKMVRPHVAIVTKVAPVHLEHFDSVESIARAKAEIFEGLEPGGAAIINGDIPYTPILTAAAYRTGAGRIIRFGEGADNEVRLQAVSLHPDCSTARATVLGHPVTFKVGAPGRHVVLNSLAVLAAVDLLGGDLARAAMALGEVAAPKGRGARHTLHLPHGEATLIDESYNANPASMRAAIAVLGQSAVGFRGRRIAVLGDMLELGDKGEELHADLAGPLTAAGIDRIYLAGPLMHALWVELPCDRQGAWAPTAKDLEATLIASIQPGDAVMVKGSNGSRMGSLVEALKARFASTVAVTEDL
ncbi:UDP-N-acetylmuramoylalanyl-D-glutamyl-2,6-diaminopimelate--D-alanyl-D-alanine ligase [Methyloraptor flagellatus]|uniref:UDP-N-acetylmuramoyl-tripeptide--D-alanyl-D-alanine ligase n=1 Tax=Methyloraptor flagellatus TaxID=3162530 RepID=A0AAU7XBS4_9HYPH